MCFTFVWTGTAPNWQIVWLCLTRPKKKIENDPAPVQASDAEFDASNIYQPCHNCRNECGIYARTWQDIEGFPEAYNYVDYFPEQPETTDNCTRYARKQINSRNKDVYYCENCEAVWSVKSWCEFN